MSTTHPLDGAYQRFAGQSFRRPTIEWNLRDNRASVSILVTVSPDDPRQSYRDTLATVVAGLTPQGDYAADIRMAIGTNPRPQQIIVRGATLVDVQWQALEVIARLVAESRAALAARQLPAL